MSGLSAVNAATVLGQRLVAAGMVPGDAAEADGHAALLSRRWRAVRSTSRSPVGVGADLGDVPAAEVGGEEQRPVEGDVGRMAEDVCGRILGVDLELAGRGAQDPRRVVERDVEIARVVEGDAVGQTVDAGDMVGAAGRAAVGADGDAADLVGEGLDHEERAAVVRQRHAVGEAHRLGPPERAFAGREVVAPDPGSGARRRRSCRRRRGSRGRHRPPDSSGCGCQGR